ncbi:MAG: hypothetical protein ABI777_06105 [Betaproteobacteria bacterium]
MKRLISILFTIWLASTAGVALATFHTFRIDQVYSNADGTIQFVLLHESSGLNGQNLWVGQSLSATHAGRTKTVTFPSNLPSSATANRYVLVATQGYLDASNAGIGGFGAVFPDYVLPNQFLPTDGGTINFAGVDSITYTSLPTDGDQALYTPLSSGQFIAVNQARNFSGAVATVPALAVTAVEFYNPSLDHYFISNLQPDIDALDSGRIAGWSRTGYSFYVNSTPAQFLNPVCRFYIPPQHGNSHFFSASPAECDAIASRIGIDPNYSGYIEETPSAFYVELPNTSTGACPGGTTSVYRLWNNRFDSNHRYTTSRAVKIEMQGRGYIAEGYGPDAVAMCSPI